MKEEKKVTALRGACCAENNSQDMVRQVCALYDELLRQNNLTEEHIISVLFSVTPDLDEKNPAAALRQGGRAKDLALFAVQEAVVKGGLERCVRVLIHAYTGADQTIKHIYQNGAEILRPDRAAK